MRTYNTRPDIRGRQRFLSTTRCRVGVCVYSRRDIASKGYVTLVGAFRPLTELFSRQNLAIRFYYPLAAPISLSSKWQPVRGLAAKRLNVVCDCARRLEPTTLVVLITG